MIRKWWSACLFLLVALLAVTACDSDRSTSPYAAVKGKPVAPAGDVVEEIVGQTGPGSVYSLSRPPEWNGELVVWAHGFIQPFLPVDLPTGDRVLEVREALLAQGFGFAYSSYSLNGYSVKDGAQRTHQLSGLYTAAFGRPSRTYLIGPSLGGLIAEYLVERFPGQYDGTLTFAGVLGGGAYNAGYVAHVRVLFDWFYPGVLPGSLYEMPEGEYLIPPFPGFPGSPIYQQVVGALMADLSKAAAIASIEQVDLQYASYEELLTGMVWALGYQINNANALTELLKGHGFFDNSGVVYSSPLLDAATLAALNDPLHGVRRYTADPPAANYLAHWWGPTGRIAAPFLSLHLERDPLVPWKNELIFRDLVGEAGRGDLLVQRSLPRFGHTDFSAAELLAAFADLVSWVRDGVKPAE